MAEIEKQKFGISSTPAQSSSRSSLESLKRPEVPPSVWSLAMTGQSGTTIRGASVPSGTQKGKLVFQNTSDWDGSYPAPLGRENLIPPSASANGKTYYHLQTKAGNWITSQVPFCADDLESPAGRQPVSQVQYSGVISDVTPVPAGASLPSGLPKAEPGKPGVFNNVFVNAVGIPLSEYGPAWTPPSWAQTYQPDAAIDDPYIKNYPYKWQAGMVLDGPWEQKGTLGTAIAPSAPTSSTSLMGAMGRGRADLPNEVISRFGFGETQSFEFDISANGTGAGDRGHLGVVWYGDGGAHAPVRVRLFDQAGKLIVDAVSEAFSQGLLSAGHYRAEVTGMPGDYRKDGQGNPFLLSVSS